MTTAKLKRLAPNDHYAANGVNASLVFRATDEGHHETRIETFGIRKGREEINEAVQIQIDADTIFTKTNRRRNEIVCLSFTTEQWAEIVEFVKENHTIERKPFTRRQRNPANNGDFGA